MFVWKFFPHLHEVGFKQGCKYLHQFLSSWNESNFSLTSRKIGQKKPLEIFRKFLDCHDQIWSELCNLYYQSMYHLSAIIRNQWWWWWFSEHSKSEYSKASVNTISVNTIFEITWFWLLSQIFQFYMISPKKPLNKDNIISVLLSLLRGFWGEISVKTKIFWSHHVR